MPNKIRVAIAEDHDLVRQGMISLLSLDDSIEVVFDVPNGQVLLDELAEKEVDVILLDLEMPVMTGNVALPIITEKYPAVGVIIVSMHYVTDLVMKCVSDGAKGFLPKQSDFEKVVEAITSVHELGFYFDGKVSQTLVNEVRKNDKDFYNKNKAPLTPREIEIIELVCDGKKNKEIADMIFVSPRTVEGHRRNISEKTETANVVELVIYALKFGIFALNREEG